MTNPFKQTGLYQKRRMWALIGMLMLVVIIPTVCLLWFVSEAVRNERMAVRQQLTELYQSQLESLPPILQDYWEQRIDRLSAVNPDMSPGERFNKIIGSGLSDSIILFDDMGELLYPCEVEPLEKDLSDFDEWNRAESLEFRKKDDLAAAELYANIAGKSENINIKARALQRQIRCLIKAGKKDAAVNIVASVLSKPEYNEARDNNGRLIVPDTQLFVLQSIKESSPVFQSVLEILVSRLKDYTPPVMPSTQRMFLMKALKGIEKSIEFPTLDAEELASSSSPYVMKPGLYGLANASGNGLWQVVTSDRTIVAQIKLPTVDAEKLAASSQLHVLQPGQYALTKVPEEKGLWQIVSSDFSVIALFKQDRIERDSQTFIDSKIPHLDADILFVQKDVSKDSKPILRMAAGDYFPDWELIVQTVDNDFTMEASEKQISMYIWIALLIIVGILILAVITTRLFVRQMSLARMKNDLITTVSHELKTPLASIRLLVDTLIDGRYRDENLVKEYIELISKENERLTRLVENFLTFSRLEDKRQTFNFKVVKPDKIVQSVYDTIRPRFESGGFSFELKASEKKSYIVADYDAMVMVLLNLLDNAYHYSDKVKSVHLAAYSENGSICFEVADKGIGMSSDQRKKILEPFYQVDQTLSRRGSGFGLGLSIVKSIVDVHHGSIEVKSELGKGSVFTIKVPEMK
jgi:signal transduction histidine kinase